MKSSVDVPEKKLQTIKMKPKNVKDIPIPPKMVFMFAPYKSEIENPFIKMLIPDTIVTKFHASEAAECSTKTLYAIKAIPHKMKKTPAAINETPNFFMSIPPFSCACILRAQRPLK